MTTRCAISILLLLVGFASLSQSGDRPQQYVVIQNDTIYGTVKYLNTQEDRCFFTDRSGEASTYRPTDISAFSTDQGRIYRSDIIENNFVESLVLGKVNLYFYRDKFYVQKESGDIHLLEEETGEVVYSGTGTGYANQKANRWKLILNYLMSDCSSGFTERIKNTKLSNRSLIKLITSYNRCKGSLYFQPIKENNRASIFIGVLVGATSQVIKTVEEDIPGSMSYLNTDFRAYAPVIGITAEFSYPRLSSSLSNEIAVIYTNSNFEETSSEEVLDGTRVHETSVSFQTLSIPISLKNRFQFPLFDAYLKGGVILGFNSGSELDRTTVIRNPDGSVRPFAEGVFGLDIEGFQIGYQLGTGIEKQWKHFSSALNLDFNSQSGFWKSDFLGHPSSKISRFTLSLSIKRKL